MIPIDLEMIGLIVGAVLTLMLFSYVFGDNVLYRWALALLVGGSTGYLLGVLLKQVLWGWILVALDSSARVGERFVYVIPLLLGVLLIFKGFASPKVQGNLGLLGNITMGFLLGVGAAVAVSGALLGTLIPQMTATGAALSLGKPPWGVLQGLVVMVGVGTSLLVFSPRERNPRGRFGLLWRWTERLGYFFILCALALLFSGALTTALTTLVLQVWRIFHLIFPA